MQRLQLVCFVSRVAYQANTCQEKNKPEHAVNSYAFKSSTALCDGNGCINQSANAQ